MKIGKRTQELMNIYALSNEEVCFSQLIAAGRTQLEAYCIAFHDRLITSPSSPQRDSSQLIHDKPNITALTRSLQAFTTDIQKAKDDGKQAQQARKRGQDKNETNITTKDGQLRELRQIYSATTDNKQRQDILKQIADLQRLKQEENTDNEQRIHYFLPEDCDNCPFNQAENSG